MPCLFSLIGSVPPCPLPGTPPHPTRPQYRRHAHESHPHEAISGPRVDRRGRHRLRHLRHRHDVDPLKPPRQHHLQPGDCDQKVISTLIMNVIITNVCTVYFIVWILFASWTVMHQDVLISSSHLPNSEYLSDLLRSE